MLCKIIISHCQVYPKVVVELQNKTKIMIIYVFTTGGR